MRLQPRDSEPHSRHTREEVVRIEAIAVGIKRTGNVGLWTLIIVVAVGALIGVGFALPVTDNWRWWAFGAAVSAAIALAGVLFVVWDILHRLVSRPAQGERVALRRYYDHGNGRESLVTDPPFDREHKLRQFKKWMLEIHHGRATLSQDGARDSSKSGGRAYGLDAEECSHVKTWAIQQARWFRWINESNGTGQWTPLGERALAALARGESWEYVLSMRWHDRPTPAGDGAQGRESVE